MTRLLAQPDFQNRHVNKEPEWSRICDNVFDQYLVDDDPFGLGSDEPERSCSDDSGNLVQPSEFSEQSQQTLSLSPIPAWEHAVRGIEVEKRQPRAKEPFEFWEKTLRALEQNAVGCERKEQKLRATKSHPDFLSLGGYPSPPAIPSSPVNQSPSAQRQVSRAAACGKKRNVTARSVSRGRPAGVTKSSGAAPINPYATVRKCSASPPKMMNPSRYRAGFKDAWVEKLKASPERYELRVPPAAFIASPPPSERALLDNDFAVFEPFAAYSGLPVYDDQVSPLTNTFQHAHIQTPITSPMLHKVASHAESSYFDPIQLLPTNTFAQRVPLNDTSPIFPERTSSLANNKIQSFDFGFSNSPENDTWSGAPFAEQNTAHYTTDRFPSQGSFGGLDTAVFTAAGTNDFAGGLGISCDPSLVSNFSMPETATLTGTYHPSVVPSDHFYLPPQPHVLPSTPHRRSKSRAGSRSPSPPATAPRSRRSSASRKASSRHLRAKSLNSTPRHSQSLDKGGFVNFTPQDSNKILSGVAPSGSSKTKARREKEAAEKRRRLSQAAVRAVVEAGGNLDALSKAGLLT